MTTVQDAQHVPGAEVVRARWSALFGSLLYLGFYTGMVLFNAHPPHLPLPLFIMFALSSTIGYLIILVYTIRLLCRLSLPRYAEVVGLCSSLLLFLGLNPAVWHIVRVMAHGGKLLEAFGSMSQVKSYPVLDVITPFFLILTGVFFGQLIARLIRERAILVPVALVAGLIDFWGVYWGFVGMMSNSATGEAVISGIGSAATASAAIPDEVKAQLPHSLSMLASITPPQTIGIGDFVFIAFFLTCAYRLGFSVRRTMWGIFGGLLFSCIVLGLDGITIMGHEISIPYLPGLVFICGGLLLANLCEWKLSRQEWAMTAVPVVLLLGCIGYSITSSMLEAQKTAPVSYTLDTTSGSELYTQMLTHISRGKHAPAEILPLQGVFTYLMKPQGPLLVGVELIVLGHERPLTVAHSREYFLSAQPTEETATHWVIEQRSESPPEVILAQLKKTHTGDDLSLLRLLKPLPVSAHSVLSRTADFAKFAKPETTVRLCLLEKKAVLFDANGTKLQEIPYTP